MGFRPPDDTSPEAAAVQLKAWQRLGPERRLELALGLSDDIRQIARDGVRHRHPEYSENQVRRAFLRLVLGDALVREIWPGEPLVDP